MADAAPAAERDDAGGESVCYAHLICPECGRMPDAPRPDTCPECGADLPD